jgi:hypothetical protein
MAPSATDAAISAWLSAGSAGEDWIDSLVDQKLRRDARNEADAALALDGYPS